MKSRRVVITGLGALTPLGNDLQSYWNGLKQGVSGANAITKFDASKFKTQFACEINGFDPQDHFDRKEIRKMDPFSQYAIVASEEAVQDAGIDFGQIDRNRAGVIWGSGIGGLTTFQDEITKFAQGDGTPKFNPFFIPKMIIDIAAGLISIKYGLHAVNYATVSACASSSNSIAEAFQSISTGRADLIITGGSEASVNEAAIGGFNAMRALSQRNDEPKSASRPFDKSRDGFVLGEGAGALILEDLEHAQQRGAKIYGEVAGCGMSADAYHLTAPEPDGTGATLVMNNALEDAELGYSDLDYINVHGTSTPLGDVAELRAIRNVFGDEVFNLNISSTKSMTGHLLGAAGAIEALACIQAINQNIAPPTINVEESDDEIDQRYNLTFNKAQNKDIKAALSNTFGFGGHNVSIIIKQFEE